MTLINIIGGSTTASEQHSLFFFFLTEHRGNVTGASMGLGVPTWIKLTKNQKKKKKNLRGLKNNLIAKSFPW